MKTVQSRERSSGESRSTIGEKQRAWPKVRRTTRSCPQSTRRPPNLKQSSAAYHFHPFAGG
jgi:hypothetical protein